MLLGALPYLLQESLGPGYAMGASTAEVYVGNLDLAVRDVDLMKLFAQRYSSVASAKALHGAGAGVVVVCRCCEDADTVGDLPKMV